MFIDVVLLYIQGLLVEGGMVGGPKRDALKCRGGPQPQVLVLALCLRAQILNGLAAIYPPGVQGSIFGCECSERRTYGRRLTDDRHRFPASSESEHGRSA